MYVVEALVVAALTKALVCASPVVDQRAAAPTVVLRNGTVVGSTSNGIDNWTGIPFAQPPVGPLRLKPPQSITTSYGTITATGTPTSCPGYVYGIPPNGLVDGVEDLLADLPIFQNITALGQGEDCLTINVHRPAGTKATDKLPVFAWIFGGGFEIGSASMYDGSQVISKSVALGEPVLFVAMNYRVAGFGFLAGKELQRDGSTNLGLRDQRLGLEWIAENIAAFGGDPNKVTIWGESAGAISVMDQTIINGGDNTYNGKALFRAGIMNSGSIVPARTVDSAKAQEVYDAVINAAGCANSADSLNCLRSVDYQTFLQATTSVPGLFNYQSLDLAYVPRPDPHDSFFSFSPDQAIAENRFAKVPVIVGDQEDEGTLFSLVQSNVTTEDKLVTYLNDYFPGTPRSVIQTVVDAYPAAQSAGSPFGTGPLPLLYPEQKRLSAILGDITFTLVRRAYALNVTESVPIWSYLNTYLYGTPLLGTFHASDLLVNFFLPELNILAHNAALTYYISFANHLDPNRIAQSGTYGQQWPRYDSTGRSLLEFKALKTDIIKDDFRSAQYDAILAASSQLRI